MSSKQRFLVVCSAHEGGNALKSAKVLGRQIERTYQRYFGGHASITRIWLQLPKGHAYIAGQPSTATTVLAPVPDDIQQEERVRFMRDVCSIFQERTGCDINEIIVAAINLGEAKRYAKMSRLRFDPRKAKGLMLKILSRMLIARPSKGYLATTLNMPS